MTDVRYVRIPSNERAQWLSVPTSTLFRQSTCLQEAFCLVGYSDSCQQAFLDAPACIVVLYPLSRLHEEARLHGSTYPRMDRVHAPTRVCCNRMLEVGIDASPAKRKEDGCQANFSYRHLAGYQHTAAADTNTCSGLLWPWVLDITRCPLCGRQPAEPSRVPHLLS